MTQGTRSFGIFLSFALMGCTLIICSSIDHIVGEFFLGAGLWAVALVAFESAGPTIAHPSHPVEKQRAGFANIQDQE